MQWEDTIGGAKYFKGLKLNCIMDSTEISEKLPYFVFAGGIAVCRHIDSEFGLWHPAVILPYFWQDNALWVSRSLTEHGFEKACPVDAFSRWPDHTDFFIILGVVLCGYAKIDGYMPVFLETLKGDEAILWKLRTD